MLSLTALSVLAGRAYAAPHFEFGDVVVAGDLNGDGVEDSAVGGQGAVYVILSKADGHRSMITLHPPAAPAREGTESFGTVLALRDTDHDGRLELIVGEPQDGLSWIYHGDQNGFRDPILQHTGEDSALSTQVLTLPLLPREECVPQADIPWDKLNALQKHVIFFDLNGDRRITLKETYQGLRDLGLNPALSAPFAVAINGALATPTAGYPTLTISVENIEGGIHGSDSGIYDAEGHFVPAVFHQWFQRWDADGDGALNAWELTQRWYKETDLLDFFGAIASGGEFSVLYLVAAEHGKISEARMRGLYDGSLFYAIAADRGTLGCRVPFKGE